MPHEVKMPQLGMTQDSGVIVAWQKSSGDRVAKGDVLFEVETDKATMEVEATADGYLSDVRADAGSDVPVGDVIALIVDDEPGPDTGQEAATAVADRSASQGQSGPGDEASPAAPRPAAPQPRPPRPMPSGAATGRILASPKARRLAAERGIDLAALRAQGMPEPIHAGDLPSSVPAGQSVLMARVDGGALNALLERSEGADRTRLFAAFAAGAWRKLFGVDDVAVEVRLLDGTSAVHANPDRGGGGGARAVLSLVDLCDTRVGAYAPAGGGVTVSAARDGKGFALTLSFGEGSLAITHAIALLDDIAARIEDPIRQLLHGTS